MMGLAWRIWAPYAPLTPDQDEARRWAEDELSRAVYAENSSSLIDRVTRWFSELLESVASTTGSAPPTVLVGVGLLVVVAVIVAAFVWGGPVRSRRRVRQSADVFDAEVGTAADLLAEASAAAVRHDWSRAVLMRFRAMVRALDERALLRERPGLTAFEATEEAAVALPERRSDLREAGRIFDDVHYGERVADHAMYNRLETLADLVDHTRPARQDRRPTDDQWAVIR